MCADNQACRSCRCWPPWGRLEAPAMQWTRGLSACSTASRSSSPAMRTCVLSTRWVGVVGWWVMPGARQLLQAYPLHATQRSPQTWRHAGMWRALELRLTGGDAVCCFHAGCRLSWSATWPPWAAQTSQRWWGPPSRMPRWSCTMQCWSCCRPRPAGSTTCSTCVTWAGCMRGCCAARPGAMTAARSSCGCGGMR